jgi:hypothetical protein
MGLDPDTHGPEVRAHLGVVPQQDNLAEELRGRDFAEAGVLISEYAPQPPINGGTLATARPEIANLLRSNLSGLIADAGQLEMRSS